MRVEFSCFNSSDHRCDRRLVNHVLTRGTSAFGSFGVAVHCSCMCCSASLFVLDGAGPTGMRCLGQLSMPIALPGFVVSTANPTLALQCAKIEACLGGNSNNCAPSYTGNRCAQCVEGTYLLNQSCEPCGVSALIWILGVLMPCLVLVGALSGACNNKCIQSVKTLHSTLV